MAYKVKITESAERDLNEILFYIAIKSGRPHVASEFADTLQKRFLELEEHPLMFEQVSNKRLAARGYRRLTLNNYNVFYLVEESVQEVIISRIFYCRQDYAKHI